MQVNELFRQSNTILLDGGMGTMLQAAGLKLGARPEELNITDPALIEGIHGQYAAAGSHLGGGPLGGPAASSTPTPLVLLPTSWQAAPTRWSRSSPQALKTASAPARPTVR